MASHPVAELTSSSSWAMVSRSSLLNDTGSDRFSQWVEDKFSPYAKETLAKLIAFSEVRRVSQRYCLSNSSGIHL